MNVGKNMKKLFNFLIRIYSYFDPNNGIYLVLCSFNRTRELFLLEPLCIHNTASLSFILLFFTIIVLFSFYKIYF